MENDVFSSSEYNGEVHKSKAKESDSAVNHSGDGPMVNGYSNGLEVKEKKKEHRDENKDKHRDKHKDKHRDRDRDKEKDRQKEKEKHRDRDKEKDRHKDRDHKSSSSSNKSKERSDRDKEKSDKDRSEKDKERGERDKERSDKDKERHREKVKDGKHKDKEHKGSSSSKDKEKTSSSSKHSSSGSKSERDKDRDKHKSSKDKERSDKSKTDKEKSERSDKEKSDKEKHRDKSSSKSDREKSDKDKERHKEKSKHSSSSKDKEKRKKEHKESGEKLRISFPDDTDGVKKKVLPDSEEEIEAEPQIEPKMEEIKQEFSSPIKEHYEESFTMKEEIKEEPMDEDDSYQGDLVMDESRFKTEPEDESDEDIPLSTRKVKREMSDDDYQEDEDEDDLPLTARKKPKKSKEGKKRKKDSDYEDDEEDFKPKKKKKTPMKKERKSEPKTPDTHGSPTKKKKKEEEDQNVWKWWEEEKKPDGVKWNYLEHKGPVFAPPYDRLPRDVKFFYDGKEMALSEETEEVASFYAKMLEHDYVTKEAFNKNFFKDWRKVMTSKEKEIITDLSKCNFKAMHAYFTQKSEERKAMSKEEKKALKEKNEELVDEYGFCVIDGHKEKIGNFKLEPPGLFRGRGEHPKMGMLKKRLQAEDIIINCSKEAPVPPPPQGHKWKEVRHDNSVTWLASWTENVQGQVKYIMLNPSSKLKGEKDWQKYETARKLATCIDKIRREYREDWKSKEMRIRQRAVALYFIDILALRAGNEKDEDQADTVGCCSLRVEHIELLPEKDGKEYVVVFDFLGKDSIRYYNEVPVEKRVFKNVQLFMEGKKPSDDLFDRLTTQILNKHLNELMEGLTAKVFRTYNASWTLQQQLRELTNPDYSQPEMILAYNRANRAVAILCNHQRSIPKSHQKSMENLKDKITQKKDSIEDMEKYYKQAKKEAKNGSAKEKIVADKAKKKLDRLKEQLQKLEVQETDREENKTIALGTSKLNYLDPRISVAWCKKFSIPIEKVYNKTQRSKFRWAIDMATADYVF